MRDIAVCRQSPVASRQSSGSRPRPFSDDESSSNGHGGPVSNGNGRMGSNGNGNGRIGLPLIGGRVVDPTEVTAEVEAMGAEEAIAWAAGNFGEGLRIACSFQKSNSAIIEIAHRRAPGAGFFYLDTELLFPQTYGTRDALARRYGIEFERFAGISVEEQETLHGASLWARHPDACCGIRKVEPMREALRGAECWVSGIRRSDSSTRAGAAKFGWDRRFGLWKLNPLADWGDEEIWNHIRENDVPYNPLHDEGYPSIGCTHCTARPGEADDDRSGRWAGRSKTECGING